MKTTGLPTVQPLRDPNDVRPICVNSPSASLMTSGPPESPCRRYIVQCRSEQCTGTGVWMRPSTSSQRDIARGAQWRARGEGGSMSRAAQQRSVLASSQHTARHAARLTCPHLRTSLGERPRALSTLRRLRLASVLTLNTPGLCRLLYITIQNFIHA